LKRPANKKIIEQDFQTGRRGLLGNRNTMAFAMANATEVRVNNLQKITLWVTYSRQEPEQQQIWLQNR